MKNNCKAIEVFSDDEKEWIIYQVSDYSEDDEEEGEDSFDDDFGNEEEGEDSVVGSDEGEDFNDDIEAYI